ncbi:hypothetical protein [Daejeonella oryzae]|uniref:hypothetical protein n=1 Tax=Daejeonella oryzae TaxID=1122943 RepID=UPI0004109C41|nr:hypothetical protein [Daejeonella oryzae]
MEIFQARYIIFFLVVLIVPAGFSYLAGIERNADYLFFVRAFGIAFFLTVFYYLYMKNSKSSKKAD